MTDINPILVAFIVVLLAVQAYLIVSINTSIDTLFKLLKRQNALTQEVSEELGRQAECSYGWSRELHDRVSDVELGAIYLLSNDRMLAYRIADKTTEYTGDFTKCYVEITSDLLGLDGKALRPLSDLREEPPSSQPKENASIG